MPTFVYRHFWQTYIDMYAQLFSMIRINWDVTRRSSFLKSNAFIAKHSLDELNVLLKVINWVKDFRSNRSISEASISKWSTITVTQCFKKSTARISLRSNIICDIHQHTN